MIEIIPAVLPKSYRDIENAVAKVGDTVTTMQIDFVDGTFATSRTWPYTNKDQDRLDALLREEEGLPLWDEMNYEFDLMLADPLGDIETFIALGPARIIFHIESFLARDGGVESLVSYFESLPEVVRTTIDFGVAINIDTDIEHLVPCLPYITAIQCMGITHVGFQGQAFDPRVIDVVAALSALYPEIAISVDGGMNLETAPLVAKAGASRIVAGSAVFGGEVTVTDVHGAIAALRRACWI